MNDMNIPRYTASNPVQKEFITNADHTGDHIFRQVKRTGDVAIYSRTPVDSNRVFGFEVVLIKTVKAGTVFAKGAKPIENDYESYPGGKAFGKTGWFCVNLAQAESRFAELVKAHTVVVPVVHINPAEETNDIPEGEFTQVDFATMNCLPVKGNVYNILQKLIEKGVIKVSRKEQRGPGRPTTLYIKA